MAEARGVTWRTLLVGGAGYLGARLAGTFLQRGEVVATARSDSPLRKQWRESAGSRLTHAVFDSSQAAKLPVEGEFDLVVNLAMPGAAEAARNPVAALANAERTTGAVLRLVAAGRARRLIHLSTFHVYGAHGQAVYDEADSLRPSQPYGEVHAACECMVREAALRVPVFIARPTNVVGAPAHADLGPQARLLFMDLCRHAAIDGALKMGSDGLGWRDFLPMNDFLAAMNLLADAPVSSNGGTFNLASGKPMQVIGLAQSIQAIASERRGAAVSLDCGTSADVFARPFIVKYQRLRQLGWIPTLALRREIQETLDFFGGTK